MLFHSHAKSNTILPSSAPYSLHDFPLGSKKVPEIQRCFRGDVVPWRAFATLEMAKAKAGDRHCPHSVRMALVAASAATAEAVTFPIDFGKTRMQLHSGRWIDNLSTLETCWKGVSSAVVS